MTRAVSATARFVVTVDVPLGSWNASETMESLAQVAKREGTAKLRTALHKVDFRVVGEPKLRVTMTEEE